jgi:hypothetical protein
MGIGAVNQERGASRLQSELSGLALPASNKASASTEAPTKVDPSGNTLTIVVDRG